MVLVDVRNTVWFAAWIGIWFIGVQTSTFRLLASLMIALTVWRLVNDPYVSVSDEWHDVARMTTTEAWAVAKAMIHEWLS